MKSNINLLLCLFVFVCFGLTSCDSDDDNDSIVGPNTPDLVLGDDSVKLFLDEQPEITLGIEQGAGNYDIFSLNTKVATAELIDNKIKVKGVSKGNTSIIVLDNKAQLKYINVDVLYKSITLDENPIVLEYPLGQTITVNIPIVKGNGNYIASMADETIASVTGTDTGITITTKGIEGEASISLTDAQGCEATLKIKTKSSMEPYNKYQLDEIMNNNSVRYFFNNTSGYSQYGTPLNRIENGMNLYGWDYYNYYYLKVYFPGDKTVGDKPNSIISYKMGALNISNADLSVCKVIKTEGETLWMVFSYLKDGAIISGYIVTEI